MNAVGLGMPAVPPPHLAPRRKSRQIMVGSVPVGDGAPVSVQSMTTTLTSDVNATLQQIAELTASGCQIVRVAVPSQDDADALPLIAKESQIVETLIEEALRLADSMGAELREPIGPTVTVH